MKNFTNVDMFSLVHKVNVICITTNCTLDRDGNAVMGAGVALEAARRWPNIRRIWAEAFKTWGNVPCKLGTVRADGQLDPTYYWPPESDDYQYPEGFRPTEVWSFPVKGEVREPASVKLILQSSKLFYWEHRRYKNQIYVIPRPGCGVGGLYYPDVEPVLDYVFEDFQNEVRIVTNERR